MARKAPAPRRSPPLPQLKLRITDELRNQIELAAEANAVSTNREIANRLGMSFHATTTRRFEDIATDIETNWHRWAEFWGRLERQTELINAASALVEASELAPGKEREAQIRLMADRVKHQIRLFEIEAANAARRQRSK